MKSYTNTKWHKIFTVLKNNHVDRNKVDWDKIEAKLLRSDESDINKIQYIIDKLGNPHTLIINPGTKKKNPKKKTKKPGSRRKKKKVIPRQLTPDDLFEIRCEGNKLIIKTYCYLPEMLHPMTYLQEFRRKLEDCDQNNIIDEIVFDLSENTGGDGVLMLFALNPIFRLNKLINYFYIGETFMPIKYNYVEGFYYLSGYPFYRKYRQRIYKWKNEPHKLTVVIGKQTGSAAEWITIALLSLKNIYEQIKFIGEDTTGICNSVNNIYTFRGTSIAYTVGYHADIKKNIYYGPLKLDVLNKFVKK